MPRPSDHRTSWPARSRARLPRRPHMRLNPRNSSNPRQLRTGNVEFQQTPRLYRDIGMVGDGGHFRSVREARSGRYRAYLSDERQRNGQKRPRLAGLGGKSPWGSPKMTRTFAPNAGRSSMSIQPGAASQNQRPSCGRRKLRPPEPRAATPPHDLRILPARSLVSILERTLSSVSCMLPGVKPARRYRNPEPCALSPVL